MLCSNSFSFADCENVACWTPRELSNFLAAQISNKSYFEASLLILLHLVNINTIALGINRVVALTGLEFTFRVGVDCESVVVGFPVYTVEIEDLTLDEDLLLRELVAFCVVEIEKFNTVLS